MIYFLIVISTLVYFFFLTINKSTVSQTQDKKIKITLSLILSLIFIYIFSNSYDYSNVKAYKSIYSKNLKSFCLFIYLKLCTSNKRLEV